MKLDKMAAQDAEKWAAAEMFYGEGAGIRRRHAEAEISEKMALPGYAEAFNAAYDALDMNKFAQAAIRERKTIDRAAKVGKNFRAFKSGNLNNLSSGIFVVVGGAYLLRATGYDKVVEEKAKAMYKQAKVEVKVWNARRRNQNVTNIFQQNQGTA